MFTRPLLAALFVLALPALALPPSAQSVVGTAIDGRTGEVLPGVLFSTRDGRTDTTNQRGQVVLSLPLVHPSTTPAVEGPWQTARDAEHPPPVPRAAGPIFIHPSPGWVLERISTDVADLALEQAPDLDGLGATRLEFHPQLTMSWFARDRGGRRFNWSVTAAPFTAVFMPGPSERLKGRVRGHSEKPLPNTLLLFSHDRHGRSWARTDERGDFATPGALPMGTWRVEVFPGEHLGRLPHVFDLEHTGARTHPLQVAAGPRLVAFTSGAHSIDSTVMRGRLIEFDGGGRPTRTWSWLPVGEGPVPNSFVLQYPRAEQRGEPRRTYVQLSSLRGNLHGYGPIEEPIPLASYGCLHVHLLDGKGAPAKARVRLVPVDVRPPSLLDLGLARLEALGTQVNLRVEQLGSWRLEIEPLDPRLAPKQVLLDLIPGEDLLREVALEPAG